MSDGGTKPRVMGAPKTTRDVAHARHLDMARMRADGAKLIEIAEHFHITQTGVHYALKRLNGRREKEAP